MEFAEENIDDRQGKNGNEKANDGKNHTLPPLPSIPGFRNDEKSIDHPNHDSTNKFRIEVVRVDNGEVKPNEAKNNSDAQK